MAPDGTPGRVSWVDGGGNLLHRPFDGPFPPDYPAQDAIRQCQEVFLRLLDATNEPARDHAYAMLHMAEAGLHSFDHEAGRSVNAALEKAGMDEDTKRTVILKLHENPEVGQLLLQRCGIRPRWLAGNPAKSLSCLMRHHEYTPAFIRNLLKYMGNDPDADYMIGPDYRIPEPSKEDMTRGVEQLQEFGFSEDNIRAAMGTLGVPSHGRHPPKPSSKKNA